MSADAVSRVAALGSEPLTEDLIRRHIRPLFSRVLAEEAARGEIYLANHSLGRPLDETAEDIERGLELWYRRMDEAWGDDGWPMAMQEFRERIARLIGLSRADGVIPKTSAGQGLRAVLNALPLDGTRRPVRVLTTRGEFDSIDLILKQYAVKGRAQVVWAEPGAGDAQVPLFTSEDVLSRLEKGIDLLVISLAFFTTGQLMPEIEKVIRAARELGAWTVVDVYHAVGVVPVDMEALGADFLIGGSYKYLRGGPGACYLAVHPRVLDSGATTLDTGWFAKRSPFRYERPDPPVFAEGGDAWLESTPPVLTMYQAAAGQRFTLDMGVERLRDYGLRQLTFLRARLRESGLEPYEPDDANHFGAFCIVPHPDAAGTSAALKQVGINTDARGGCIRFGPDLLTSEEELDRAAKVAATVLGYARS